MTSGPYRKLWIVFDSISGEVCRAFDTEAKAKTFVGDDDGFAFSGPWAHPKAFESSTPMPGEAFGAHDYQDGDFAEGAHCGCDPAAVGCCGGTDAKCSCECNTCQDPNEAPRRSSPSSSPALPLPPDGCDEQGYWTWQGERHPPPRETSGASRDGDSSELASPVEVANTTPARGPEEAGTSSSDKAGSAPYGWITGRAEVVKRTTWHVVSNGQTVAVCTAEAYANTLVDIINAAVPIHPATLSVGEEGTKR